MADLNSRLARREFLKLAGAVGATASMSAFLAACSTSGTTAAPPTVAPSLAAGATPGASAAPTPGPKGTFNC